MSHELSLFCRIEAQLSAIPYGLVVRIPAFHAGGPGSIPGVGANFVCLLTMVFQSPCVVFITTNPSCQVYRLLILTFLLFVALYPWSIYC